MFASPTSKDYSSTEAQLTEVEALRLQIAELSKDVGKLVELRARQVQRLAGQATDAARGKIEDYPLGTMAGAFAAGAVIGLLLIGSRSHEPRSRFETARDDLASYADDLKRGMARTAKEYSLTERLDRMASALSSTDAKETLAPAFDRVLGWFGQAKSAAQSAAQTVSDKVKA